MGNDLKVEKEINKIKENAYELVIQVTSEAIKTFNGEPLIGKEKLADFINSIKEKLLDTELTEIEVANIGLILISESPLASFTGGYYPRLEELAYDVENIELLRNPTRIQEKK
ncbi:hypothetical protein [Priestia aryabhattai]|uniref:hypothetical protein n=1 Tax=Priestia aryabhattai TaxID=412384 RepID=UPI001C8E33B5|nr:hypothetical protein [Priestia aryabhattai]MBY0062368.1 hypothetical protein [Priestia aryabhattai]